MARSLTLLKPEMYVRVKEMLERCTRKGVEMRPYCTVRALTEQAVLYRQSRTRAEIEAKIASFRKRGYILLAEAIEIVGPCYGPHVTNAAPGESWHNYGYAVDCVPIVNGNAEWNNRQLWYIYGQCAKVEGLFWGGDFKSFKDNPHVQYHNQNPLEVFKPEEIEALCPFH